MANDVIQVGSDSSYAELPTNRPSNSLKTRVPRDATVPYQEERIDCSHDMLGRTFRNIVYGQILSLCLCGTGVSSEFLSREGVNTPTAQSFLNYFLLLSIYLPMLIFHKEENYFVLVLRKRGWRYLLLSIVDVEANYIIICAYQYTNLTSVQLLNSSTIPMVLLLSWLFLFTRYLWTHITGVGICLIGFAVIIWADAQGRKDGSEDSNRLLGDVLCLAGSFLYAVGNVGEEFLVKQNSRIEYLGMVGLFGSVISGMQLSALEYHNLASINWSGTIVIYYLVFAASMFIFYSMVSVVLQKTSALVFNLSILTAGFYNLMFGLFIFKYEFHALYFVSFVLVIIGSVIYSIYETEKRDPDEPRYICCVICHCCTNDDSQSPGIPQQHFPNDVGRTVNGIGIMSNTEACGTTNSY